MKTAYVTAYVKKKDDYGSISILPNLSKVFIRSIYNKLSLCILITYCPNTSADLERVLMPKIV